MMKRYFDNQAGATMIEYALIMSLMTLVMFTALSATGDSTSDKWNDSADKISAAHNSN